MRLRCLRLTLLHDTRLDENLSECLEMELIINLRALLTAESPVLLFGQMD